MILFYDCVYGCSGNEKRKSIEFLWISDRDTLACIETIFRFLWISDQDTLVRPRNLVISIDFLSRYGCTQDKP
jgi:hypothetical protein